MKNPISIILFLIVLLSSCSHYYYVADIQNVPLFKEKNEMRFSGAFATGDESNSIEIQAAYAATDKIGVIANYMHAKGGEIIDRNYGKGNYFEGGAGYYKPIEKYGVFEIYGGLGGGSEYHEYSEFRYNDNTGVYSDVYDGNAELSLIKLFIQPSFGFTYNICDVAVSARFCRVSFTGVENQVSPEHYEYDDLNTLSNKSHLYLEPAITLRAGWKNIKVQFQASYSAYLNSPRIYIGEEVHVSAGLYFTLAGRLRRDAAEPGNAALK
jgi:hypothetical protein